MEAASPSPRLLPDPTDVAVAGLWQQLVVATEAESPEGLLRRPFFSRQKTLYHRMREGFPVPRGGTRVYHDVERLPTVTEARRSFTGAAAVAVGRDTFVQLVSGRKCDGPLLPEAVEAMGLLSLAQRRAARGRVLASMGWTFARGGFPPDTRNPFVEYETPVPTLFLHIPVPVLDHVHLEGGDLVRFSTTRAQAVEIDSEAVQAQSAMRNHTIAMCSTWFLAGRYKDMVERDLRLVLHAACQEAARLGQKLWLKLPPLGASIFTYLGDGSCLAHGQCIALFLEAVQRAVAKTPQLRDACVTLELPDFTPNGAFTPRDVVSWTHGIPIVCGREKARDLLEFHPLREHVYAVVVGGTALALPGNARDYSTLESMVGNNTTLRKFGSWIYNPALLDPRNYVGVRLGRETKLIECPSDMSAPRQKEAS